MGNDRVYDVIAEFAAGLVTHGVTDVVISPGSRSTPLSVSLHAHPGLTTWIQIDERSAGFFALGQAKATGRASVLVCTSGTAAANYLPAVVEAHHSGIPLIVCTADRPPELRDWGAGQTIDQVGIYGTATRWAADLPVAGDWTPDQARIAAHRAVDAATGRRPGPVHLNWPLREPLEPVDAVPVAAAASPTVVGATGSVSTGGGLPMPSDVSPPLALTSVPERGVIVLGPDAGGSIAGQRSIAEAARRCAYETGWPLIAEPISGARSFGPDAPGLVVSCADHLLKVSAVAEELAPDLVVRIGGSPTTKPVRQWLERHQPATVILVDPDDRWNDASFTTTHHYRGSVEGGLQFLGALGRSRPESTRSAWLDRWTELEATATQTVTDVLAQGELLSPLVSRSIGEHAPAGTIVMTSNSMPVRDLDAFIAAANPAVDFVGNRGASGIDGITSTALGLASRHDGPVVLYTGDIALLHDLGALFGAQRTGLRLTIVCVDNDGGGIFSMLPIAARGDEVDFETLFRTPHGIDLAGFSGVGGVIVTPIETVDELQAGLQRAASVRETGVEVLLVTVDRDADVAQRRAITAAVGAAVAE